jgi:Pin2-interacting protein X1
MYLFIDTSSFGRKMLEKMGWKSGQGLGLNCDGTTSHIKIALKDNTLGIGASIKDAEGGWLNNSKSYQEVLDRLSKANNNDVDDDGKSKKTKKNDSKKSNEKAADKLKVEKKSKKSSSRDEKSSKKKKSKKSSSSDDEKSSKKKSKKDSKDPVKQTVLKSAHRAKFIRNKAVSTYSEASLKEILGGINI